MALFQKRFKEELWADGGQDGKSEEEVKVSLRYNGIPEERMIRVRRTTTVYGDILALVIKIGIILLILAAAITFVFGIERVGDNTMAPAIKMGDLLLYYRLDKDYSISECCVINFDGERQVRRVVARSGDTVDIDSEGLVINGAHQEDYRRLSLYEGGYAFPVTLGEGEIFVLGDATEGTADSRIYGPVKASETEGAVVTVLRRRNI
ncbi:MAG: signal peptidase I [Lachnospiraceae bacterium]|nr:signal peptidase I [Lachnospiraceae bacterium]